MSNQYIEFYSKHNISPVRQDISDFDAHLHRRAALYTSLGVPPFAFSGKRVLEIGPGGGYNALATCCFAPASYHLAEPNPSGYEELKKNLASKGFDKNVFPHNCTLEELNTDEKFDIVLCEGLVQGLSDKVSFLTRLGELTADGGMLIITSADEISMFFEIARRHLANIFTKDAEAFSDKIQIMTGAFDTHLDTIKGMTRRHDDWCSDLMCDAMYNHTFSISDAEGILGDSFYLNETCPRYFTDSRWYKALPSDTKEFNRERLKSFDAVRHGLMDYRHGYSPRDPEKNIALSGLCKDFIRSVSLNDGLTADITADILINISDINPETIASVGEFLAVIKSGVTAEKTAAMGSFASAFGRGQTFISFSKVF